MLPSSLSQGQTFGRPPQCVGYVMSLRKKKGHAELIKRREKNKQLQLFLILLSLSVHLTLVSVQSGHKNVPLQLVEGFCCSLTIRATLPLMLHFLVFCQIGLGASSPSFLLFLNFNILVQNSSPGCNKASTAPGVFRK